jgi:hypothetical protein
MTDLVEQIARILWRHRYRADRDKADWIMDAGPTRFRGKPAWHQCIPDAQEVIFVMRVLDAQHIYTLQPGEDWRLLPDGGIVVVHPDRPPFILHPDGTKEVIDPKFD